MKRFNLFYIVWIATATMLVVISFHYRKQSDAIVAEVEPQKTAISFQKAVKVKAIHVIPGQDVKEGELLLEVERPDLLYEIEKTKNQLNSVKKERDMYMSNVNYQMELVRLDRFNDLQEIDAEILELETEYKQNVQIIRKLESLESRSDTLGSDFISLISLRLGALRDERKQVETLHDQQLQQLADKKKSEMDLYELKIEQLDSEIKLLEGEENYLKNYSPVNGTLGDIFAQIGELIEPYTTIMTIYNQNPTIIKAYLNESNLLNLQQDDKVIVESSNRAYSIEGKVIEIGSRIVTYPMRLLPFQDRKIWGQELFIEIPENNSFLNGEKVYVKLKK